MAARCRRRQPCTQPGTRPRHRSCPVTRPGHRWWPGARPGPRSCPGARPTRSRRWRAAGGRWAARSRTSRNVTHPGQRERGMSMKMHDSCIRGACVGPGESRADSECATPDEGCFAPSWPRLGEASATAFRLPGGVPPRMGRGQASAEARRARAEVRRGQAGWRPPRSGDRRDQASAEVRRGPRSGEGRQAGGRPDRARAEVRRPPRSGGRGPRSGER